MKHTEETRKNALEMMKEIGAQKTHEATGISLMTLYKWRNAEASATQSAAAADSSVVDAARKLLAEGDDQTRQIISLEQQVAALTAQNAQLTKDLADQAANYRKQIAVLKAALSALLAE